MESDLDPDDPDLTRSTYSISSINTTANSQNDVISRLSLGNSDLLKPTVSGNHELIIQGINSYLTKIVQIKNCK